MEHNIFEKVFSLIELSFPKNEYRSYENQKKLLENPLYHIHTKLDVNDNLLAAICFWNLNNFIFIEHFAVSPSMRGCGIGSEMLQDFISKYKVPIVLEVELPENEISIRRIKFYEKNGFNLNTYRYLQMPLNENSSAIELYLMSYPICLNDNKFQEYKKSIYKNVYSVKEYI